MWFPRHDRDLFLELVKAQIDLVRALAVVALE